MFGLQIKAWGRRNATLQEDIEQSLSVLLLTRKGEKIWDPHYGCDLVAYLDRPNWHLQLAMVAILESISAYEPRIRLLSIGIAPAPNVENTAQGKVVLRLAYQLIGTQSGVFTAKVAL